MTDTSSECISRFLKEFNEETERRRQALLSIPPDVLALRDALKHASAAHRQSAQILERARFGSAAYSKKADKYDADWVAFVLARNAYHASRGWWFPDPEKDTFFSAHGTGTVFLSDYLAGNS